MDPDVCRLSVDGIIVLLCSVSEHHLPPAMYAASCTEYVDHHLTTQRVPDFGVGT